MNRLPVTRILVTFDQNEAARNNMNMSDEEMAEMVERSLRADMSTWYTDGMTVEVAPVLITEVL